MAEKFSFSRRQVVMLENYFHHVNAVPDDELLKKLTSAVVRMDKANSGVTEALVREWFVDRELNGKTKEPKEEEKEEEVEEEGVGEGEKKGREEGERNITESKTETIEQRKGPVRLLLNDDKRFRSFSTNSAHSTCGPILHVKEKPIYSPSPVRSKTQPPDEEDELLGDSPKKLTSSLDRNRPRTISSGNLKNILTRTGGAPALSRSGIKAHSARELRGDYSPSDADCFVTRSRVHHNWPEIELDKCRPELMFVEVEVIHAGKFSVEAGSENMREDFSLFDQEDNLPHFHREYAGQNYVTFGGSSETHGPVVVTMKHVPQFVIRDGYSMSRGAAYVMTRTVVEDERLIIPFKEGFASSSTKKALLKAFKKHCSRFDGISFSKLLAGANLTNDLIAFENHYISEQYKFGLLYYLPGQSENEMFCNKEGSKAFDTFLNFLGDKICLEGWGRFRGGLDVKSNTTGTHAYFTEYNESEIIFHVSTLLPYDDANEQQLERKRHIGNDVVAIIFIDTLDPSVKWDPEMMCSQVNQIFVLVRPCMTQKGEGYYINIVNKKGVPPYHPFLSIPPVLFRDEDSKNFFLLKIINSERAAMCAPVYRNKLRRSRRQMLQNIIDSHPDP